MTSSSKELVSNIRWMDALAIILALALQVLVTLSVNGTQIRVALADFLLPLMLLALFLMFRDQGLGGIRWRVARVWVWVLLLTLWLSVALVRGIFFTGGIQTWALVNKYFGWYVLMIFFVFGGAVANRASPKVLTLFFALLFLSSCLIGLVDIYPYLQTILGFGNYFRMEGLAGNPNAYGFLLVVIVIVLWARQANGPIVSNVVDMMGIGLILALIVLSGSRSAWLGLCCGLACLALARRIQYIKLIMAVTIAGSLVIVITSAQPIEESLHKIFAGADQAAGRDQKSRVVPYVARDDMLEDSGVKHRLEIFRNATALWSQYPLMGVGLGGYLWSELREGRTSTIHTTALWLLTDTGLIGLLLFAGFLVDMMWQLWSRRGEGNDSGLIVGGLAILATFAGASIGLEAMYQRHVWIFAGMALACSPGFRGAER